MGVRMATRLAEIVGAWCDSAGIAPGLRPEPERLALLFGDDRQATRPGVEPARLASWEARHGFALPAALRAWLLLSDGFYAGGGPMIHPLSGIGPMVAFAKIPGMVIQPESWFELGNPNWETICLDLAYRWPGGDSPMFTSGDDEAGSPPRIIAPGFASWFLRLLDSGGSEFWFEPGFAPLGDPWAEHCRRAPAPPLPERLRRLAHRAAALLRRGLDDRALAEDLAISPEAVEAIVRHLQHAPGEFAETEDQRP